MISNEVRLWINGVLLATGSVLLFYGGPQHHSPRVFIHLWDTGHIIYFALLASLLSRWHFIARQSLAWQWTIILVSTLLAGVSIELLQHGTGRMPDTGDVLRDVTGSLVVLAFGSPGLAAQLPGWRRFLKVAVLVLLLVQLWPLTRTLVDEAIAWQQFPILSSFETPFELGRWEGNAGLTVEPVPSISPGKLLKLTLTTDPYSGVKLRHFAGDWTAADTLSISIYNPDDAPLQITCRIHDLQHADGDQDYEDRFNKRFLLRRGWNHIAIDLGEVEDSPAGRSMDMSHILGLGIFVMSLSEPRSLYLDNVRLSP
ncbi:MAG: VanZ family protein [Gammaproteobacteria bacterium]|jgi:hypothetical protein